MTSHLHVERQLVHITCNNYYTCVQVIPCTVTFLFHVVLCLLNLPIIHLLQHYYYDRLVGNIYTQIQNWHFGEMYIQIYFLSGFSMSSIT